MNASSRAPKSRSAPGRLRIVTGAHGGQWIRAPKNAVTHPMGERERIALFNRLGAFLPGARVLDAFAGSGALGLTALSAGAQSVDFLERDPEAIKTIKDNLKAQGYADRSAVLRSLDKNRFYDVIFADPPYDDPQYALVADIVAQLNPGGILALSHPETPAPPAFEGLVSDGVRCYATARIELYHKQ